MMAVPIRYVAGVAVRTQNSLIRCLMVALLSCGWPSEGVHAEPLAVPVPVLEAQANRVELISRISPAVVAIFAPKAQGGGSGVLISPDGFAVTNFHVVQGLGNFMQCGLNDGKVYHAVVVGVDPTGDVAIIRLLGRDDFPVAKIGDSDAVRLGDPAIAAGNPFLLADDFQPTVTWGMVSGVHRYQYPAGTFLEYTDCLQVDASINPGNSGGPLFNAQGEVIGINGRISVEKRGKVNVGAGYAISINQVMHFLDHLKSGRIVDHATLGATVYSDQSGAVLVKNVLENSAAWRRGLRPGDELVSFAGRPIRSVNQFKNILGIFPKGWKLPLSYRREGQLVDVMIRLEALHTQAELSPGGAPMEEEQPENPGDPDAPDKGPMPKIPQHMFGEAPAPPPREFAKWHEEKPGFVNYYFNRIATERLMKSVTAMGEFGGTSGLWTLTGQLPDGTGVQFKLTPDTVAAKIGEAFSLQSLGEEEELLDQPAGTGGLLMALHHFRQLLAEPKFYFTELYYLGSEPGDDGNKVDVLVATKGLTSSRWYFSRPEARLIGFDFSLEEDVDPCEVRFADALTVDGRSLPKTWTVRRAGQEVLQFTLTEATLGGAQP